MFSKVKSPKPVVVLHPQDASAETVKKLEEAGYIVITSASASTPYFCF